MPLVPDGPAAPFQASIDRAIRLAAAGSYVPALSIAQPLDVVDDRATVSVAAALRASILRQLRQHARATTLDERALAYAVGPESSDTRVDALAGLAADAIGDPERAWQWWQELAWRLPEASPRARVRAWWVGAEIHLASDRPWQACELAERAAELAPQVTPRHQVKSTLVLGVARLVAASGGQAAAARQAVDLVRSAAVAAACQRLRPLLWASAVVLSAWLPDREGERWRGWASDVAHSIAIGLTPALRAGWMSDPAVAALLGERG
jgi:tetratricopeptide (TPR) repeat protein